MVARSLGCLVLFALSVKSLLGCQKNHPGMAGTPFKRVFVGRREAFTRESLFFPSSVMAIVSVTVKDWSVSATRCNILVLLSVFGVYLYRDIRPLATFTVTEEPKDLQEGYMFWVKFSIITLTAVIVIPLFIPRKFFLGCRVPHLRSDQLPPLSDPDYSKHITKAHEGRLSGISLSLIQLKARAEFDIASGSILWR
ncbi:hypothetical protein BYT27DRAFT_7261411 [Phlegmacium glaucopus]|nr:hypothetical protein BYT27DRAFT_7261411 [Phlegmacium glaucopus]